MYANKKELQVGRYLVKESDRNLQLLFLFQNVDSDCGECSDDDAGKKNTAHNRNRAFLEIHIQERGC